MRRGIEYNQHLVAYRTASHMGKLPREHSFFRVSPDNVILNLVKRAEDSGAWVLRIVETEGRSAQVRVTLDRPIQSVQEVNLIERPEQTSVEKAGKSFVFAIRPYEIRTFALDVR